jgi:nicotinamide-nucleotide amidase
MKTTIITIGDEILIGTTVDTNSAWIAQQLNLLGIEVHEIISVSDESYHIMNALKRAEAQSQLILITGGLGPTNDDITKKTLAEYFGVGYKLYPEILDSLKAYFDKRGIELLERNKQLAELPENCTPVRNLKGTAWGMWFERNGKVFMSMPGVPTEMKNMMEDGVLPKLKQKFSLPAILHQHIHTASIGESLLAEKLKDFETQLPKHFKLAYLPNLGFVTLRLTARGNQKEQLELEMQQQVNLILERVQKYVYSTAPKENFEEVLGNILTEKKLFLSTAESCTGGYIAHKITSVAGSSAYYKGSVIAYDNNIKINELNISNETINTNGAVSEETVKAMVLGINEKFKTDVAIAVSGIAGPGGGTEEKPVGTVWIAVGNSANIATRKVHLPGNRLQVIKLTSVVALEMLRRYLLEIEQRKS